MLSAPVRCALEKYFRSGPCIVQNSVPLHQSIHSCDSLGQNPESFGWKVMDDGNLGPSAPPHVREKMFRAARWLDLQRTVVTDSCRGRLGNWLLQSLKSS